MSVPGADRRVEIGDRGGAREARIDHDQLGAVVVRLASITHLKPTDDSRRDCRP